MKTNKNHQEEEMKETAETEEQAEPAAEPAEENAKENYQEPETKEEAKPSKEEEYLAMAQRIQADFDNYRKRNLSARADALADGKAEAIKAFLPVMDNLDRALATEKQNGTEGSLMEGLEMILKQMQQMLKDLGVTEVEAEGQAFDPNKHNAVMQIPCADGQKPGMVAAVFAKGYQLGDKVLRYAMVQVTV